MNVFSDTYYLTVTQETLQINWSILRQGKQRDFSTVPPEGGHRVSWLCRARIKCGQCGKSLGDYVVYRVGRRHGLVEDTTAYWHPDWGPRRSPHRSEGGTPRFRVLEEDAGGNTAFFYCARCRHEFNPRKASRLGHKIAKSGETEFVLKDPFN
jgi:hypothetical protein